MPFVLRPVDAIPRGFGYFSRTCHMNDPKKISTTCWRLIGECYVNGIMDGELIGINEKTGESRVKGSEVQDFILI
jgi:hypothetical protein